MARRYARDNRGRFSSTGATARGGRLRTAAGNKRATVTSSAGMVSQGRLTGAPLKGTIGKTSKARLNMGLTRPSKPGQREAYNAARTQLRAKPASTKGARLGGTRRTTRAAAPRNTTANKTGQSKTLNKFNSRPVGTKILNAKNQLVASTTRVPLRVAGPGSRGSDRAFARVATKTTRLRAVNKRMGDRPDLAQVNIKGRFSGQAGKRMDASIDRAVKQVKAAEQARLMKPKAQVKAERAAKAEANRQAAAAKPKRIRSAESLRTSRAKQIEKRRSITTNPAGERASAAAKMAANATRTQQRATAFYKANASKKRR